MNVRERLEAMLRKNDVALLACPFCGCEATNRNSHRPLWLKSYFVECSGCGATGSKYHETQKDADSEWNSRPFIRALLAAIEQRNSLLPGAATSEYEYRKNQQKRAETEGWMDARLLAILEGREG